MMFSLISVCVNRSVSELTAVYAAGGQSTTCSNV